MKGRVSHAICLALTLGWSTQGVAQSASVHNTGSISLGYASFGFLPAGPTDRIHLNEAMMKSKPNRRYVLKLPASLGDSASRIRHLVAAAEAGRDGYDAVQHGARRLPPMRPTRMTIDEIYQWTRATPGQPHAIGRCQLIPKTLKRLVKKSGLDTSMIFSEGVQDHLADLLLQEAGFAFFLSGEMHRHRFMENLARIWAGLPTSSGRSYYHGYAGNRAVISWDEFDAHMSAIYEQERLALVSQ